MLKDKTGELINVEGGVQTQPGGMILITGKADWEVDGKTGESVVTYRGKQYRSTDDTRVATTGCATHMHAADWDADGDLDLLVGSIRGNIYLIPNEGNNKEWAFGQALRLTVSGSDIVVSGDAAPFCIDWDGDGDLDLLTGEDSGRVLLFENTGSVKAPIMAEPVELVTSGTMKYGDEAPQEIVRGGRSKVWATDWNEDGLPDLLVGDISYQKAPPPKGSAEELERIEDAERKLKSLQVNYREAIDQIHGAQPLKGDARKAAVERLQEVWKEMEPLQRMIPEETLRHGSVWLFLQKSNAPPPTSS